MIKLSNSNLFRQRCYINGEWLEADNGKTLAVTNPAEQIVIGEVPACEVNETRMAVTAAATAFSNWKKLTAKARSEFLISWAQLIERNIKDLGYMMTLEQGKPLSEAIAEIEYANSFIKWFAEEGRRVYGDIIPANQANQKLLVIKQPIGVVAAITPWNFPAAMITRKLAPALAAGCTVVVKPDAKTPFTALALMSLAEEAGFPAGVINMVTGEPELIGRELTTNPLVQKLSFTGSTRVGKLLMQQCAPTLKKLSLELGGNAPFIVFEDADLEAAVTGLMSSKFRNMGQTCVCANRILVQTSIYNKFAEKLQEKVSKLVVGKGTESGVQQGPLIDQAALAKVTAHIKDAVAKGGQIQCGGKPHSAGGLFFEPTIITETNSSMLLAKEETFGPIAPLFRFTTEEEAITMANDTEYGLASYFYTQDVARIWRVAEALEYGMVGINSGLLSTEVAPFGGIKQSGMGREGSKYGIEAYLEIKYLCLQV